MNYTETTTQYSEITISKGLRGLPEGKPRVDTENNWRDIGNIFHFSGLEVDLCVCQDWGEV